MRARRAVAERKLERRSGEVAALLEATRHVTASLDLGTTLGSIIDAALALAGADVALVGELDPVAGVSRVLASAGPLASAVSVGEFTPRPGGILETMMRTRRPIMVDDLAPDTDGVTGAAGLHAAGLRSLLVVPMMDGGRVVGGISVLSRRPNSFASADERVLVNLADTAALAIAHAREVNERRRAEAELRAVLDALEDPVFVSDMGGRTRATNRAGAALRSAVLGGDADDETGLVALADAVDIWDLDGTTRRSTLPIADALAGKPDAALIVCHALGYEGRHFHARAAPIRDPAGVVTGAVVVLRDVSPLHEAAARHERAAEALAQAHERTRMAMELHDGTLASLAAVSYQLGGAARLLGAEGSPAAAVVERAVEQVAAAMDELRAYAVGLRAAHPAGLHGALVALADIARDAGVAAVLELDPRADELAEQLGAERLAEVLQIAREAVANALRHAGAPGLTIRLIADGQMLELVVGDDGAGFDPASGEDQKGQGLANMAERARRAGGELAVKSRPGAGTEVRLSLAVASGRPAAKPNGNLERRPESGRTPLDLE